MNIVALAGGVGGAKLVDGLQRVVGESLTVIVNTADDFELHGLYITPDLDTVMYTLAGIANVETGWGIAGDTFHAMEMFSRYNAEDWFNLGDRDLATHILRTKLLRQAHTLTDVIAVLASALGVRARILPMTDARVSTIVKTVEGELPFQEYFVHRRWQPVVQSIRFAGIEKARITSAVAQALDEAQAIIFCPSNPFVSLDPILSVRGVSDKIRRTSVPKAAVSSIVGGEAIKGPAAKMFRELGKEPSAIGVAAHYRPFLNRFVLDQVDEAQAQAIKELGMRVWITDTVMRTAADRARLATEIVEWISR